MQSDSGKLSSQRQDHIQRSINNTAFLFHTRFVMLELMKLTTSAIFTDELLTDEQLCYHANNGYATLLQHIKKAIEPNDNEQLLTLIITDKWFIYNFAMDIKLVNAVYPHFNGNPYCISFNVIWKLFFAAFEIIDLAQDDPHLKTVPQQIGVKRTKNLGFILISVFCGLAILNLKLSANFQVLPWISEIIIAGLIVLFLAFANKKKTIYYTSFWVESLPIFWLVVLLF